MSKLYGQGWFGSWDGVKEWSEKDVEDSIPTHNMIMLTIPNNINIGLLKRKGHSSDYMYPGVKHSYNTCTTHVG